MLDTAPGNPDFIVRPNGLDHVTTCDIARFLRSYARTIVLSLLIGIAGALLYIATAIRLYTAQVQLLIDSLYQLSFPQRSTESIAAMDTPQDESQTAVLRSDRLAAQLPRIGETQPRSLAEKALGFARHLVALEEPVDPDRVWRQVIEQPASPFSSSVRALIGTVSRSRPDASVRTLGITSTYYGEGKSTLVCNLASLAQSSYGRRTLVVDARINHATFSQSFVPMPEIGLLQILAQGIAAREIAKVDPIGGYHVLPVGATSGFSLSSVGAVGLERFREILANCLNDFDLVIVDLPPIEAEPDILSLLPAMDGLLIAAEFGKTPLPALYETVTATRKALGNLLGLVLAKVDAVLDGSRKEQERILVPAGHKV